MSENLNSAQTIFTIFFAIYYAVTVSTTTNLKIFDTATMNEGRKKYPKSWSRFFLGFFFINIFPLGYFWIVLQILESVNGNESYRNFFILFIIFFQSLIGYGFYRILFGLLMKKKDGNYIYYDKSLYDGDEPIEKVLEERIESHKNLRNHILPGVYWILFAILFLLILILIK